MTGWAAPLPAAGQAAAPLRRPPLWAALGGALLLHTVLVAYRPASMSSDADRAVAVMTVRTLPAVPSEPSAGTDRSDSVERAEAEPAPVAEAARDVEPAAVSVRPGAAVAGSLATAEPTDTPARTRSSAPGGAGTSAVSSTAQASPSTPPAVASRTSAPAAAEADLPDAPDYLLGARLDPGPRPLGDIDPAYPESANLQEGTVVIRLLIGADGNVDNVAVVRSHPKGLFEQSALEAFGRAKFAPGYLLGTPVKSQVTIEVHFQPINRGARVSGRTY